MGIYVSEINMPKGDDSKLVLQIFPNGEVYDEHGIRLGITNWAEAVPVPPHGRLGDLDALVEKAWDADTRCGYVQVVDVGDILDAPTIIEAEEGE